MLEDLGPIQLTAIQRSHVVEMINDLSDPTEMRAIDNGGNMLKLEMYEGRTTRASYYDVMIHLLYTIPRLLGLKTIVVDVNNRVGLYEYVADKYSECKFRKEIAVEKTINESDKTDGDWPDFSIESHAI